MIKILVGGKKGCYGASSAASGEPAIVSADSTGAVRRANMPTSALASPAFFLRFRCIFPGRATRHSAIAVEDNGNWPWRAQVIPVAFDQGIANLREGMRRGITQPQKIMTRVLRNCQLLAAYRYPAACNSNSSA
jgi:uncharacterized protein (DUF885 family)